VLEYWHMGLTTMRLRSVSPRSWNGVKSVTVMLIYLSNELELEGEPPAGAMSPSVSLQQ